MFVKIGRLINPYFIIIIVIHKNAKKNIIWVATQRKEPYVGKIKIEFCIACSRGYSAGHFGTKIMHLAQFLTELLGILSFKTCIMKN